MTGGVSGGMESRSQKWDNQAVEGTLVVMQEEVILVWRGAAYDVPDYYGAWRKEVD